MKKFLSRVKMSSVVAALLFIILGIFLLAYPLQTANVICCSVGTAVLIYGLVLVLRYFGDKRRNEESVTDIVMGIILCGVAVFMFVSPALLSIITLIFGVFLVIDGAMNLQKSFQIKKLGYDKWWIDLIFGAVSITGGILLMTNSETVPMLILGICLIYDGLMNLISIYSFSKAAKQQSRVVYIADYEEYEDSDQE